MLGSSFFTEFFEFMPPLVSPLQIIALFTYPFLCLDFITLAFACMWLFWIGGSLERSWGSGKFLLFFLLMTPASGIGLLVGYAAIHQTAPLLGGLWLPVTSLTVAWATINPYVSILLYGLIPIQARWIAVFEVGVIYFVYYQGHPVLGLFVLAGALSAYLVVKLGVMTGSVYRAPGPDLRIINGGQGKRRPLDDAGITVSLNPINRFKAWQQRRKLAKLLQKSGFSDRDDDKRRR
jgi:membrane associated rhomboid family serine protease